MSLENVELAHRFYDCVNRRDLDAWLAVTDEHAELMSILVSVDGGYHGHAGSAAGGRTSSTPSPTTRSRSRKSVTWEI